MHSHNVRYIKSWRAVKSGKSKILRGGLVQRAGSPMQFFLSDSPDGVAQELRDSWKEGKRPRVRFKEVPIYNNAKRVKNYKLVIVDVIG